MITSNENRIRKIESNMRETQIKYDNGLIDRELYDRLNEQGNKTIKELKELIRKGELYT